MQAAIRSSRRNQTVLTVAALAGLGLVPAATIHAADIHWNIADGNWDTPANWVGGVVPGNADRGKIDRTGGGIARVTTDIVDVKGISVAAGNTLSVEAGGIATTLANTPDDVAADGIWIADGGAGTANVTAGGTLTTTGGGYQGTVGVGRGGGTGTLTISGATSRVDGNDVHIGGTDLPQNGGASAGNGTVNLQSGTLNARAWSFIGRNGGTGSLAMTGGTFNSNGESHVGFGGGTGLVTMSAGTYSVGGQLHIADGGSQATFALSGGTVSSGNDLMVGNGNGANGVVTQTGGTMTNNGGWAFVGRTGGTGVYNMSGGSFNVNGNMNVGFEPSGVGTMTQSNGATTFREVMHVGRAGGNGTYNLSGGTMTVGDRSGGSNDDDLVVGADAGTGGTLNQTGGTLNVARWGFVGRNNGNGVVNQTAGTYNSQGWLRVAEVSGSVGSYNLSGTGVANVGGGDTDTGDDDVILGIDPLSNGSFNLADTAVLNGARDLRLGLEGGNGTFSQTGGDANFNGAVFVGNNQSGGSVPSSGTVNLSGGTFDATIDMNIGAGINTSGQVTISGTSAVTVNGVTRVGENGAGVLDQTGGTLTTGSVVIAANAGSTGDYNFSGGTLTALSVVNNGTFDASGTATGSLGPVTGTGPMTVANTASLTAQHVRLPSLAMTGGTVAITPTGTGTAAGVSVIPSYSLTGTAKLDIGDNKLITNNALGTESGGTYSGVLGDIQRARTGGTWTGAGLTTSRPAATTGLTGIGATTFSQKLGIGASATAVFAGQTVTGAQTLAMYTYGGDANLDGFVSGDDYSAIDFNIAIPGSDGWINGDFNLDGIISGDDYSVIDFNIVAQGAPFSTAGGAGLSGVTAVPEPAALGLVGLGALGLLRRRRFAK